MPKQVAKSVSTVKQAPVDTQTQQSKNLYFSVKTFDGQTGRTIGERIVDQYHFGTRNWLQNHLWWAMHNAAEVEIKLASNEEIVAYIESGKNALATKFGGAAPTNVEKAAA